MDGCFFICITVILQVDVDGLPSISARRTVGSLRGSEVKRQCKTKRPAKPQEFHFPRRVAASLCDCESVDAAGRKSPSGLGQQTCS